METEHDSPSAERIQDPSTDNPGSNTGGPPGTNLGNRSSDIQKQAKDENVTKCNGIRTPLGGNAKDRWGKLKTTMAVANSITPKKKATRLDRGDSFLRKFSTRNQTESKDDSELEDANLRKVPEQRNRQCFYVIHPSGGLMFYWLGVITLAVLYNLWTCIAREAFREIQRGYMLLWLCLDGFFDFIYICDIFVQLRTGYLQQGLMVYDTSKLCRKYLKDRCFILDLLCLIPLDVVQFYVGVHPMLRFPRFIKVYRSVRFMHLYESRTAYPNLLRVASLSHILFLGSHWFAAFYYLISEAEGFNGDWSYPKPENQYASVTRKYLASLYWSTLTLTTIGDLPPPDTNWQYVFVIVSYLIGVFIFATIVGQVGNVITNRNASRQEFERLLDGAKFYMQMHNVPPDLQRRVQRWYDYVWTRGRLNCNDINSLGLLPDKLKTELALHVNLGTLKKVTIFQKCRPEFLHDLMLKMRAYIFTPGDLICRRGEVAREMFIIADGVVEILGENAIVLTQMSTGDFFGEIGILNLDGGINRRTADVRSVGYSELFVLSREDVLAALKDHPDAEQIIREFGQRRLKETEEHRKMAKSTPSSPDLSAAWPDKSSGRPGKRDQGKKTVPQVKCLNKLQNMSPNLRKMFNRKNKQSSNGDKRQNNVNDQNEQQDDQSGLSCENSEEEMDTNKSFGTENGKKMPKPHLGVIQEKNSIPDGGIGNKTMQDVNSKNFALASVVINLLKSKRRVEYNAVNTSEDDIEANFDKIGISNIGEVVSGKNSQQNPLSENIQKNGHTANTIGVRKPIITDGSPNATHTPPVLDVDPGRGSKDQNQNNVARLLSPPKIILTQDTDHSDSSSSDSEVFENHPPTPHPARRSHVTRKSSPSILPSPEDSSDKYNRRISLPPPLDLPIEVPRFSKFRGLTRNTDVSILLERFQKSIDQRLDLIEHSYRDSMSRMENALAMQEKGLEKIFRRFSETPVKDDSFERRGSYCLKCGDRSSSIDSSADSECHYIHVNPVCGTTTEATLTSGHDHVTTVPCDYHSTAGRTDRGIEEGFNGQCPSQYTQDMDRDNVDHVMNPPTNPDVEDTRL